MSEICFSGWKVDKKDAEKVWAPLAAFQYWPHVDAIADALDKSYRNARDKGRSDQARKGALDYDADLVAEKYWKPVLEAIEQGIKGSDKPVVVETF